MEAILVQNLNKIWLIFLPQYYKPVEKNEFKILQTKKKFKESKPLTPHNLNPTLSTKVIYFSTRVTSSFDFSFQMNNLTCQFICIFILAMTSKPTINKINLAYFYK